MDYEETIKYLYNSAPLFQNVGKEGYKEGLHNTKALDAHFGHPHTTYPTIHIAGTNGKGSCAHTIAAILQAAGFRTGLYTSPHLKSFRERIRINGQPLPQQYVVDFVEQEKAFFEPLHPSFFELTTAMAFKYFKDAKADIAVIETGMGGRLDCTNIIRPILSLITNISFDHTQFLGNTLEQIAREKAGIIKANVPTVIGEATSETRPVFEKAAQAVGTPIIFAEDHPQIRTSVCNYKDGSRDYQTMLLGKLHGALGGLCQERNTNTIINALLELRKNGLSFTDENIRDGFANVCKLTGLSGRWQKVSNRPTVVCDTAHNEGGFVFISKQLEAQKCQTMHIVFGMVSDKDIRSVLSLLPQKAIYYFTKAHIKRALDETELQQIAKQFDLKGNSYPTVEDAYRAALRDAAENDFIYVGGSSYIVADFLSFLSQN